MNIKQQKQIKVFLIEEFGKEKGTALFDRQDKMLESIIKNTTNRSKKRKNKKSRLGEKYLLQLSGINVSSLRVCDEANAGQSFYIRKKIIVTRIRFC